MHVLCCEAVSYLPLLLFKAIMQLIKCACFKNVACGKISIIIIIVI